MQYLWQLPAILVTVLVVGVPFLTWLGVLGPDAFRWGFVPGVALGVVSTIVLGAAGALAAASGRVWRRQVVRAGMIPLFLTIVVLVLANRGAGVPAIHDISTDPSAPLEIRPEVLALTQADRTEVPQERLAEIQREAYPDVVPLVVAAQPNQVFERALQTARVMENWEVTETSVKERRIEAEVTSRVFRFVDDVVIQVRKEPRGSRVDVRSRSRMGVSDLGENAARIRAYLGDLSGRFMAPKLLPFEADPAAATSSEQGAP